jgi:hypothetical protein
MSSDLRHVAGMRYRIVTTTARVQTGHREETASGVLARDEVADHLELEARLMEMTGWRVERIESPALGLVIVLGECRAGCHRRHLRSRAFSPMEDLS